MSTNPLQLGPSFVDASTNAFAAVPGLHHYVESPRPHHTAADEWNEGVGVAPPRYFALWTHDLPGKSSLSIEHGGYGQGKFEFECCDNGHPILTAKGSFDRKRQYGFLKRLEVADGQKRGGLGKQFVANYLLGACAASGLTNVELKAGLGDGQYFWARRHAYIQPVFVESYGRELEERLAKLGDAVPPAAANRVRAILSGGTPDMNAKIAALDDKVDGQPIGIALMKATEPRLAFRLDDQAQMGKLWQSLDIHAPTTAPEFKM